MTQDVILRLNDLNKHFYQTVGESFSLTREQPWDGWSKLSPLLKKKDLKILDVGCGNGRFLTFLEKELPVAQIGYQGLDLSTLLLKQAKKRSLNSRTQFQFTEIDIVDKLINKEPIVSVEHNFDLIVLFGVLHHVPSTALRLKLLEELSKVLKPEGKLVATIWQFDHNTRLVERMTNHSELGFGKDDLESGDFFLNWQSKDGESRYCHLYSDQEIQDTVATMKKNNFALESTWHADGPTTQDNLYLVFGKMMNDI